MNSVVQIDAGIELPSYSEEHLAGLDAEALMALIVGDEDRVPRNVIDAAAHRGDEMAAALDRLLESSWHEREEGEWWLLLHAAMILGLIAQENTGLLLVRFMRRMSEEDDDNLQDWLAGHWHALFANKPANVLPALRELCADPALDWYIRANAFDPAVASAERQGREALDETLAWVAQIAGDETENWEVRLYGGNMLIQFPREAYRPLLNDLARRQSGFGVVFTSDDVSQAYAIAEDLPDWRKRPYDPWNFYLPDVISKRQERWAQERAAEHVHDMDDHDRDIFDGPALPHVRETPKVGRNEPCPCGSGKKYKKCCLPLDEAGT